MRFYQKFLIVSAASFVFACAVKPAASTPLETLKLYTTAIKKKDLTTMKMLLSEASVKTAEQEAKSQGVPLDDVIKDEKLFDENQRGVDFRNEKVDGDQATIEMKNSLGKWIIVPFVREEGSWKIDKQSFANQMMEQIEDENNRKLDEKINQSRQP